MLPTVLKPRVYALKNRWRRGPGTSSVSGSDVGLVLFPGILLYAIYRASRSALTALATPGGEHLFPPAYPLALMLMILFVMLLFANGVSALSSLYLGDDLDLLLASPIRPARLYFGRALDIFISSSWMVLVFGAQVIAAFGVHYAASPVFYLSAPLILLPFFVIPSGLAIVAVTVFAFCVPAKRSRDLLFACFAVTLAGTYLIVRGPHPAGAPANHVTQLLSVMQFLSLPNSPLLPASWVAAPLGELLAPTGKMPWTHLILLASMGTSVTSLAYLVLRFLHAPAYSRSKAPATASTIESRHGQRILRLLTPWARGPFRAVLGKELRLFSRDITQVTQFVLLLAVCFVYLYNFEAIRQLRPASPRANQWWQSMLLLMNFLMGAFLVTAVTTRFVFPSISLEGKSAWILRSSPVGARALLRLKFRSWYLPTGLIASVVLGSGALAVDAAPFIVLVNVVAGWFLALGLVGCAVGIGAAFVNFEFDHPSQVTTSAGSLVFMIVCAGLVALDGIPLGLMFFLNAARSSGYPLSDGAFMTAAITCGIALWYANWLAARIACRWGAMRFVASLS